MALSDERFSSHLLPASGPLLLRKSKRVAVTRRRSMVLLDEPFSSHLFPVTRPLLLRYRRIPIYPQAQSAFGGKIHLLTRRCEHITAAGEIAHRQAF